MSDFFFEQDKLKADFLQIQSQDQPVTEYEKRYFQDHAINCEKNRFNDILPRAESRVKLSTTQYYNNYINADMVQPLANEHPHILTQAPLKRTLFDFFRMIAENDSSLVICLHEPENEDENYMNFRNENSKKFFCFQNSNFSMVLELCEKKQILDGDDLICNVYSCNLYKENNKVKKFCKKIELVKYFNWEDYDVPQNISIFTKFIIFLVRKIIFLDTIPVIHCRAGVGRAGTLSCILRIMELKQISNTFESIDVKNVVFHTRKFRRSAVQTFPQYKLIFTFENSSKKNK